jgi:hypothetical protein
MDGPTEVLDLIRWALGAQLPSTRAIGQHATGRVLVALATYANPEGIAWPSTYTLESDLSGLNRRDIRNALEALEQAGLIANVGRVGRSIRWRLSAGYPADVPQLEWAGESAGEWAGEWAGESAGYPAPN